MNEFHVKLVKKINENIDARKEELSGALRKRDYLGVCGAIQALKGVLVICDQIDKELNS